MLDYNVIMMDCFQSITGSAWFPYRTGDLMKSTYAKPLINGFEIVFSGSQLKSRNATRRGVPLSKGTNYISFLEKGTIHSIKHKGFISKTSVETIIGVLEKNYGTKGDVTYGEY